MAAMRAAAASAVNASRNLFLAVADDASGLGIIAVFYGDPAHPAEPAWLGLVVAGMGLSNHEISGNFVAAMLGILGAFGLKDAAISWIYKDCDCEPMV